MDDHGSPALSRHATLAEPSRWVRRWTHLVTPGGAVLDVASGAGRHARWFAARGHPVIALDRDADALAARRGAERYVDIRPATERRAFEARSAVSAGALPTLFHLDRDFHADLAATSHNPHLIAILGSQWSQIMRVMHAFLKLATYPVAVWDDHAAIAHAVAHGEADAAVALLERHLTASRDVILAHLREDAQLG